MESKISIAEFKDRLEVLCLRGGGRGFPRQQRDQQILFKRQRYTKMYLFLYLKPIAKFSTLC
jgi:hypothetical protein